MSNVTKYPDNWLAVLLSEVIQIQKGKKPFNLGLRDDLRTVPYINIAAFETKNIAEYAPKQDVPECIPTDTLLVWDGARAGLSGRGVAGYIGSTLARITSDLATPDYLFHFINSKYDELNSRTKGVGIPHIDPTVLKEIEFPLAPLKEQTRIVEKLEELLSDLDAGVAELKAAQKKLVQYRQSLLKAAVEGKLTQHWREQRSVPSPSPQPLSHQGRGAYGVDGVNDAAASYQLHHSEKNATTLQQNPNLRNAPPGKTLPSPLVGEGSGERGQQQPTPPETGAQLLERILKQRRANWEAKQLAKFQQQGKTLPNGWQDKYSEPVKPDTSDLPELPDGWVWSSIGQCFYVGVGATPSRKEPEYWNGEIPWVSSGEVRFIKITNTKEQISKSGLNNSSTQINPIGSILLGMIGEGKTRGQVAILGIEAANNQNCAAIWVPETDIPPEYVYYWLWSRYEETRRGSSGNNQPALNKSIVEKIPFPLPSLNELLEIVGLVNTSFSQIEDQESAIKYSLKQSTAQRKNILKAAFSGQLVPQDPNDEPASVLLERIRNERNVNKIPTKRPRR